MRQTRSFKPKRRRHALIQEDQPKLPWPAVEQKTPHVQAVLEAADDFLRRTAA